jgi:EmrB/QacA subfamily drug resistance transporter
VASSVAMRSKAGATPRSLVTTMVACFLAVCFAQTALVVSSPIQGVIQSTLHASGTQLTWVSDAFMLPTVVLELTFGVLGDLFGRKRLLVIGSFLMTIGTGLTALTHSITPLFIGQAISGIGAAAVFPTSLAVIAAATPDGRSRARGLVVWTMGMSVGASFGPIIGGWLGESGDYRPPFLFVAIGTLIAGAACIVLASDSRAPEGRRLDWAGQATIVIALVALLYAIIQAPNNGWTSGITLGVLAVAVVFLVLFVVVELRTEKPLLDLHLFKIPAFTGAALVALIAFCGFLAMVYSVSIRMAVIQNQSSLRVGIYTLLLNILPFALLPFFSRALIKFDIRVVLGVGLLALAAGQFWLSQIPISDTGLGTLTVPLMLCGYGFVTIIASVSGAAVNSVELHRAGMASGAINMVRDLGQTLGIAIGGAVALSLAASNVATQLAASHLPPQLAGMAAGINKSAGTIALEHIPFGAPHTPFATVPAAVGTTIQQAAANALWHGFSTGLVITGILSLVAFACTLALVRNSALIKNARQDAEVPAEAAAA